MVRSEKATSVANHCVPYGDFLMKTSRGPCTEYTPADATPCCFLGWHCPGKSFLGAPRRAVPDPLPSAVGAKPVGGFQTRPPDRPLAAPKRSAKAACGCPPGYGVVLQLTSRATSCRVRSGLSV